MDEYQSRLKRFGLKGDDVVGMVLVSHLIPVCRAFGGRGDSKTGWGKRREETTTKQK
jgi:hypothetical protein